MSFSRFSSPNACLRFLSEASCIWLLLSQVRSLSMVERIDAVSGFPVASRLSGLITVASPMSCIVKDVGEPARARKKTLLDASDYW